MFEVPSPWSEVITGVASVATTWLFARRRNELELTEKAIEIWRKLSDDLKARLTASEQEVEAIKEELATVKTENSQLKTENATLKAKVEGLQMRLGKFIKNYNDGQEGH